MARPHSATDQVAETAARSATQQLDIGACTEINRGLPISLASSMICVASRPTCSENEPEPFKRFQEGSPKFEESRNSNRAPGRRWTTSWDALDKYSAATLAARQTLEKAQGDVEKIKDSLEAAVTGYKKIFCSTDMKDDKKAEKDFYDCLAYGNKILAGAAGGKTDLKNYASKADGWQFDSK